MASAKPSREEAGQTGPLPVIGRVKTSHGLHGEARVEVWSDLPERFDRLEQVLLSQAGQEAWFDIDNVREGPHGLLIKFKGLDTPEAVKAWSNALIKAPRDAEPLPEGTWYAQDLVGLEVVDLDGQHVGRVRDILPGAHDLLDVVLPDGGEVWIPFVAEWVPQVDLQGRRVVVKPVQDLLA